jgi:uncharacterized protein (TIRG00374 family)
LELLEVIADVNLMGSIKPKFTWKTILLPAVGIAAFIIYLYLFRVDMLAVVATIQSVDMPQYLLAASLIFIDSFLFAMAWRSLLSFLSVKISAFKAYLYLWYGSFMDIIIPAESISGEVLRVYLMTREHGNDVGVKVVASLVTHRLIYMGVSLAALLTGIGILFTETSHVSPLVFNLTLFLAAVTLFFICLLFLLCFRERWTLKIIDYALKIAERVTRGKWKSDRIRGEAVKLAGIFHSSIKDFSSSPKVVAMAIFLSSLSRVSNLLISYLVFSAIGYPQISWSAILVTHTIVSAVKAIPIGVPFEVGLPEITMTTLYTALGVPFQISATATILNRIITLWLAFFIGFSSQQWVELKVIKASLNPAKAEKA